MDHSNIFAMILAECFNRGILDLVVLPRRWIRTNEYDARQGYLEPERYALKAAYMGVNITLFTMTTIPQEAAAAQEEAKTATSH